MHTNPKKVPPLSYSLYNAKSPNFYVIFPAFKSANAPPSYMIPTPRHLSPSLANP
jgi:hypothetical protein